MSAETPMDELSEIDVDDFATVITGAGISRDHPSDLPQGNDLAVLAWRLAAAGLELDQANFDTVSKRIQEDNELRLEQLLDVMTVGGHGIPLKTLVSVYEAVGSEAFNYSHARLRQISRAQHFTVNMDTLLESAAKKLKKDPSTTHLHGKWNDPNSIVTTISQYLNELDPELERKLGMALANQSVLVVGYSARDRDIRPLFEKYVPSKLTWLVYPKLKDSELPAAEVREAEVEPEARHLLDKLKPVLGDDLREVRTTTGDFLDHVLGPATDKLTAELKNAAMPDQQAATGLPAHALAAFSSVDRWRRLMAIAAVFANQGMPKQALTLLDRLCIPLERTDARVAALKMRARILRRDAHPGLAIIRMWRPQKGISYRSQIRSVANETAATLGDTRLYLLTMLADWMLIHWLTARPDPYQDQAIKLRTIFLVRERIAGRASARGDLTRAEALFRDLEEPQNRKIVGLANWVNMLTWRADLYKVQGRIPQAIALLADNLDDAYYSDRSQAAMIEWKAAELELVAKGITESVRSAFERFGQMASETLGTRAACWIELTRIGITGGQNLQEPGQVRRVRAMAKLRPDTHLFYELQRAELARAEGRLRAARMHAHLALVIEHNRLRWAGSQTGKLAAKLILATISAQNATNRRRSATSVIQRLERIARDLDALGAELPAARAKTNASLAGGRPISPDTLKQWKLNEWVLELSRADGTGNLTDHWQIVM